jgi:hypothetical protein
VFQVSLRFVFDASVECNISFYWGPTVEACNKLVQAGNAMPAQRKGAKAEIPFIYTCSGVLLHMP